MPVCPNLLWSTDAAKWLPHPHRTRADSSRYGPIRDDSSRYGPVRADSGRFGSDSGRNQTIQADSAPILAEIRRTGRFGADSGRNKPKPAEIFRNHGRNSDISFCFHLCLACTNRLTITIICSAGRAKIIIAIYANRLWGVALCILDPGVANSTQWGSCEHNRLA